MPDPAEILTYLETIRAGTVRRFDGPTQEQLDWLPSPEGVSFLSPPPPYGTPGDVIRYWVQRARSITRRLIGAWPADANLDQKHIGGLEPMSAAEWLMGYGGQAAFHRRQIDALIAQSPQWVEA
jgi:hypothetical protein